MDYQIRSRKFWLIAIGLLLGLFIVGQVAIQRVSAQTPTATINTSAKDVHSGPDFSYSKIATVYQNETVTLLGRNSDSSWVYVTTPNNVTGWMTTTFITASVPISNLPEVIVTTATPTTPTTTPQVSTATAVPVNATAVINTGKLNVRSGPGIQYGILTAVNYGETVNLLARNPESTWALVRTSQAVDGWVNVKYITPNVAITSLPVVGTAATATPGPQATATPVVPTAVPGTAVVTASTLNVRAAAGLSYSRVDQVYYGNTVWVNGRNLDTTWISLITPDGVAGWVNAKYITSNINFTTLPVISQTGTGIVLTGKLNVRSAPGVVGSSILTSAPQGANMTLIGRSSDNSWLFLRAPDAVEGWSRADYLGTTTNLNSLPVLAGAVPTSVATAPVPVPPIYYPPTTGTGNTAVLRACPNLGCAPTGNVYTGLTITATGRTGDSTWVYVVTSNGQQGWIPSQYVQLTVPVNSLPVKN